MNPLRLGPQIATGTLLTLLMLTCPLGCSHQREPELFVAAASPAANPATLSNSSAAPLELLDELPAQSPLTVEEFALLQPMHARYLVLDNGRVEQELVRNRRRTDQFGATIADMELTFPEGKERRIQYWGVDSQGNVIMPAVVERDDNALSLFDPPLVVTVPTLQPGVTQTSTANIRVMNLRHPDRERESGTATRSVTYIGDQRIRTPMGEFVAKRIEVRFEADLRLATATERTVLYVVPDIGIVAEHTEERVRALGLFNRSSDRQLVMSELIEP